MPRLMSAAFCKALLLLSLSPARVGASDYAASPATGPAEQACPAQRESQDWDGGAGSCSEEVALLQTDLATKAGRLRSGVLQPPSAANIGTPECLCIGVDNVPGNVTASISNGSVQFPYSVGAHCDAWDAGTHPDCLGGSPPSWCAQQWCFVDPCSCSSETTPVTSTYFPSAQSQGNGLYYSYATCGGTDEFTAENHDNACVNQASQETCDALSHCSWTLDRGCIGSALAGAHCAVAHQTDQLVWGNWSCPCVGINGRNGTVQVASLGNSTQPVNYPGSMGATCGAWDDNTHPDCLGDASTRPSWCSTSWCYIDPCQCGLDVPPRVATYFPDARYHGNRMYYSYATCAGSGAGQGGADTYTATQNTNACVNQHTEADCSAQGDSCRWSLVSGNTSRCLGQELATMCAAHSGSPPSSGRSGVAAASVLLLLVKQALEASN